MIATGGTGGHIYPALALAELLKQKYPEVTILFVGSSMRMEADIIAKRGYPFIGMEMTGMNGGFRAKVESALSLYKAQKQCRILLAKEKPDICVGFGNYISVPLIMAAHSMHIPTMIHEQNSTAGKANKMLAGFADAAVGSYEGNLRQLGEKNTRVLGNPEATLASMTSPDKDAVKAYGIDPDKPFAVFMMGSLGSSSVSGVIDEACSLFDRDYQLLIAAGKDNDYKFHTANDSQVHIVPYVNGIQCLLQADVSVTRAGATTLSEIAAVGACSVLIPSPFVPNNHQVYNALELVSHNAARMIEEKDLTPQKLADTVNELMHDKQKLNTIKNNAKSLGCPDAGWQMIDWIEEILNHGSNGK